jgi:uncharacterized SAM-binding protein YcdF (DUF218 family)
VKRRLFLWGGILSATLLLLYVFSPLILNALGNALVTNEDPQRADGVLVLAGDAYGHRVLKGAELVRSGLAPVVYVSGPGDFYGRTEDQLAIAFATERGQPADLFVGLPNRADSTASEAAILLPVLRARGVRRLIVVTSNYHTARAARIFRRTDPQMAITVVASTDANFNPQTWWKSRQGQKHFFYEATKTVADYIGL